MDNKQDNAPQITAEVENVAVKQTKKQLFWEIFRFLLVGGMATLTDYATFYVFRQWIFPAGLVGDTVSLIIATALGFLVGLIVNWIMSVKFVYRQVKNEKEARSKKSFVIFFDNPGFSFFMFIYTVFLVVVSIAFFMIVPSFCGIVLAHTNGLRWRLYKYDWLEEHPDASPAEKKRIPWKELVAEDRENVGPRTLKNFIFPWK